MEFLRISILNDARQQQGRVALETTATPSKPTFGTKAVLEESLDRILYHTFVHTKYNADAAQNLALKLNSVHPSPLPEILLQTLLQYCRIPPTNAEETDQFFQALFRLEEYSRNFGPGELPIPIHVIRAPFNAKKAEELTKALNNEVQIEATRSEEETWNLRKRLLELRTRRPDLEILFPILVVDQGNILELMQINYGNGTRVFDTTDRMAMLFQQRHYWNLEELRVQE